MAALIWIATTGIAAGQSKEGTIRYFNYRFEVMAKSVWKANLRDVPDPKNQGFVQHFVGGEAVVTNTSNCDVSILNGLLGNGRLRVHGWYADAIGGRAFVGPSIGVNDTPDYIIKPGQSVSVSIPEYHLVDSNWPWYEFFGFAPRFPGNFPPNASSADTAVLDLPRPGEPVCSGNIDAAGGGGNTAGGVTKPAITSPAPGSTLPGNTATFNWPAVSNATEYVLSIGRSPETKDIYFLGQALRMSVTVNNLPTDGATLFVILWVRVGGDWLSSETYSYVAARSGSTAPSVAQPAITAPPPGSTLPGSSVTFNWTSVSNTTEYVLSIGRDTEAKDIYFLGQALRTSATVGNLPTDGSTLYAKIWARVGNDWLASEPYTYMAARGGTAPPPPVMTGAQPRVTSPPSGSTLPGSTVTFGWTAIGGTSEYVLGIGRNADANDIYFLGQALRTSAIVSNLPTDGSKLYVKIWAKVGNDWLTGDAIYQAATGQTKAEIISPTPGSTLKGTIETFTWTSVSNATGYYLTIRDSAGRRIDDSLPLTLNTSYAMTLPGRLPTDGSIISVTLVTYFMGGTAVYSVSEYTYKAASFPRILSPGSALRIGSPATFTWSSVLNASEYVLGIGRSCDTTDLYYSGQGLRTSATVSFQSPGSGISFCVQPWVRLGNELVKGYVGVYFFAP